MRAAKPALLTAVRRRVVVRKKVRRNRIGQIGISRIGIIALAMVSAAVGVVLAPLPASALTDAPAAAIPQRYLDQQVDWQPCDFDEYSTGSCRPLSGSRSLDINWQIISTIGMSSRASSRPCWR